MLKAQGKMKNVLWSLVQMQISASDRDGPSASKVDANDSKEPFADGDSPKDPSSDIKDSTNS